MLQIWEPLELIILEVLPTLGESEGLDYKERAYIYLHPYHGFVYIELVKRFIWICQTRMNLLANPIVQDLYNILH